MLSQAHVDDINKTHLRDLMNDTNRCQSMMVYDILICFNCVLVNPRSFRNILIFLINV